MDPHSDSFSHAQSVIARAFRVYKSKLRKQSKKTLTRIAYPRGYNLTPVFIVGSFPESEWQRCCCLAYSIAHNEFFIELWLKPGDTFRMVRGGHHFVHEGFPITQDPQRGTVNVAYPDEVDVLRLRDLLLRQESSPTLQFLCGIHSFGKTEEHNEDAGFCTSTCIGVADGVSAWRKQGIDGGLFAHELMQESKALAPFLSVSPSGSATADSSPLCSPSRNLCCSLAELVGTAYKRVRSLGSSTVLLAHVTHSTLFVYSLGDSQALLVRFQGLAPSVVLKTKAKVHSPGAPFQLARLPAFEDSSVFLKDSIFDGDEYEVATQAGDLLLIATDGLWDNLFESDILSIVTGIGMSERGANEIAYKLAKEAYRRSREGDVTPFQQSVENLYGKGHWTGGKPDDVTVVAAWLDYNNT